jgi:hypothetical protein
VNSPLIIAEPLSVISERGNQKDPVMERSALTPLISWKSTPCELLINRSPFHSESSHVKSSGSLLQRGGFPGLADALARSRACRIVSRFARA